MSSVYMWSFIAVILIVSVYSDTEFDKIPNWLTYPSMGVAIIYNSVTLGLPGLKASLSGIFLPVAILALPFLLKIMGAGEIKLLCALGGFLGAGLILKLILIAVIAGMMIGAFILLARKNLKSKLKSIRSYFSSCYLTSKISVYSQNSEKNKDRFRFSYAIALGVMFLMVAMLLNLI